MSTGTETGPPEPEGLQFDHAEFDETPPSVVACASCKREIDDEYYEINGTIVCARCNELIGARFGGGSGFVRYLRAILYGTVAGILGTIVYAAFIRTTNIDFALVSIFVGYLIGRAVRAGSENRGGLVYQIMATLLTYLSIGATHTSLIFIAAHQVAAPGMPQDLAGQAKLFAEITLTYPIDNARDSVITIAIVGFALWQAWKMNIKAKLLVSGPYQIGGDGHPGPEGGLQAHA